MSGSRLSSTRLPRNRRVEPKSCHQVTPVQKCVDHSDLGLLWRAARKHDPAHIMMISPVAVCSASHPMLLQNTENLLFKESYPMVMQNGQICVLPKLHLILDVIPRLQLVLPHIPDGKVVDILLPLLVLGAGGHWLFHSFVHSRVESTGWTSPG